MSQPRSTQTPFPRRTVNFMSELYGLEIHSNFHSVVYLINQVDTVHRNNRKASPETVLSWYWLLLASDLVMESYPSCQFRAVPETLDLNCLWILYTEIPSWLGTTGECPLLCVEGQWFEFWLTLMTPDRYFVAMNCDMGICRLCFKLHKYGHFSVILQFYVCIFQHHFHHNSHYIMLFTSVVIKPHLPRLPQNILGPRKKGCNG
jgi:hypothetical protein